MRSETVYNSYGNANQPATGGPRVTSIAYDSQGLLPVAMTNAKGHVVRTTYDYRFQTPLVVTDPTGVTTSNHYDAFGRLVAVDLGACPALVQAHYGDAAAMTSAQPYYERLQQRTDHCQPGSAASYSELYVFYDGLGRKVQAQTSGDRADETILTAVSYDAKGRLLSGGVPYAVAGAPGTFQRPTWAAGLTSTVYDALDRPVRITAPDGSVTRSEYGWDNLGAAATFGVLTRTSDPHGHRKAQVTDEWGNLIRVREYRGDGGSQPYQLDSELAYTYDNQNRLIAVRDAAGNTTTLAYDALGRKTAMVDPDMGAWRYRYDPTGNLVSQSDANGVVSELRYDELNRLTKKWYSVPAGSQIIPTRGADYSYDRFADGRPAPFGIGRRLQMNDLAGTVYWAYDAQGRVTGETRHFSGPYAGLANTGADGTYTTQYTYNLAGQVTSLTYPDGEVVTTDYTRRGLPTTLTGSLGGDSLSDLTPMSRRPVTIPRPN